MISCEFLFCFHAGIMAKAAEFGIGEGLEQSLISVENCVNAIGSGIMCSVDGHFVHIVNRCYLVMKL